MSNINTEVFYIFKEQVFELLFADVLQPEAYLSCCRLLPNFKDQHNELTGNLYDDLDQEGKLHTFKLALFGDLNIGELGGLYCGFDEPLNMLLNFKGTVSKAILKMISDPNFYSLNQSLINDKAFTKNNLVQLGTYVSTLENELLISRDFMSLGCVRAGIWLEEHALFIKRLILAHLENLSIENNLPSLVTVLDKTAKSEHSMKSILMAFYKERKDFPSSIDTSPLFTAIADRSLAKHCHVLFEPNYVDELNHAKSQKGVCLYDVNEISSHPDRLGLSAFGFALKEKNIDIAYRLFRSKAQFTKEEFSNLVHLSIMQHDPLYAYKNFDKLSDDTFHEINQMMGLNENTLSAENIKRFRQIFHSWLVRGSDIERQKLFEIALDREMLTLALLLSDKPGVNINTCSTLTGKTLLHIAIEHKNTRAVTKICSNFNCDFNILDKKSQHILQKTSDPILLAPIVFYLLHRSNHGVLTFMAQKVKSLLDPSLITCNQTQAVELVKHIKALILSYDGGVV